MFLTVYAPEGSVSLKSGHMMDRMAKDEVSIELRLVLLIL